MAAISTASDGYYNVNLRCKYVPLDDDSDDNDNNRRHIHHQYHHHHCYY